MYFEFNKGAKQGAVLSNMNKVEFSEITILDSTNDIKINIIGKSIHFMKKL
ncbi:hypothetical protein [Chryseobacterium sp. 3008163]|uniref:hypothetical protein n=1 Tax=Chryseobacterium sp. 3008163 TaxID=2478663 RepID=UPI0013ED0DA1|nr:hypothetical protein [Chryseobacterium sp. 3008163]